MCTTSVLCAARRSVNRHSRNVWAISVAFSIITQIEMLICKQARSVVVIFGGVLLHYVTVLQSGNSRRGIFSSHLVINNYSLVFVERWVTWRIKYKQFKIVNKLHIKSTISIKVFKNLFKILQDSRWKYTQYLSTYCSLQVNEKLKKFLLVCGKH